MDPAGLDTDVAAALHELGRRGHADAEVYALLGVGRSTLSDWRTGKHLPDTFREGPDGLTVIGRLERLAADHDVRRLLLPILRRVDALRRADSDPARTTLRAGSAPEPPHAPVLPPLPPNFVPREREGAELVAALTGSVAPVAAVALGSTTAVRGTGGYGKTVLASWACREPAVQAAFPDGVVWIELGQEPSVDQLVGSLADAVAALTRQPPRPYSTVPGASAAFAEATRARRALIVVDDVWSSGDLEPFLSASGSCRLLVTSRNQAALPFGAVRVDVDMMTPVQALALLGAGVDSADPSALMPLYERSRRWPLVLGLLNGVLRSMAGRFRMPLAAVVADVVERLDHSGLQAVDDLGDETERTVGATLELSLAELVTTAGAREMERLVGLCSFPAGSTVDFSLLLLLWETDAVGVRRTCARLADRSLLLGLTPDGARVHDVIHDYLRRSRFRLVRQAHSSLVDAARRRLPGGWHEAPVGLPALSEHLAYQLVNADLEDELRDALRDLRYQVSRLAGSGPAALANDAHICATAFPRDPLLAELARCLSFEGHLTVGLGNVTDVAATWYSRLVGHERLCAAVTWADDLLVDALTALHAFPDVPDPRVALVLHGHSGPVMAAAWRPDARRLATASKDGTVKVWDALSGQPLLTIRLPPGTPRALAWGDHGIQLAVGGDGFLALLDPVLGEVLQVREVSGRVTSASLSPSADYLLIATGDTLETRRVGDLAVGARLDVPVRHAAFSGPQTALATGLDGPMQLLRVRVTAATIELEGQTLTEGRVVRGVAVHPGLDLALVLASAPALVLVEPSTLRTVALSSERELGRMCCAWDGTGTRLAVGTGDGYVDIWGDPSTSAVHAVPDGPLREGWEQRLGIATVLDYRGVTVNAVAWQPGTGRLAVAAGSPVVRVWDDLDRDSAPAPAAALHCVAWEPASSRVVAGGTEGELRVTRAADGRSWTREGHVGQVGAVAWSPDGLHFASYGHDGTLIVWSCARDSAPTPVASLPIPGGDWSGPVAWSSRGLVVAADSRVLQIGWQGGRLDVSGAADLQHHVSALAVTPDGALILVGTARAALSVLPWDCSDAQHHACAEPIASIRLVDGAAVTCDRIGKLQEWNAGRWTGSPFGSLPPDRYWDCDISMDGRVVVAVGQEGVAYLLKREPNRPATRLKADATLTACAVSPTGAYAALVGSAGLYLCRVGRPERLSGPDSRAL